MSPLEHKLEESAEITSQPLPWTHLPSPTTGQCAGLTLTPRVELDSPSLQEGLFFMPSLPPTPANTLSISPNLARSIRVPIVPCHSVPPLAKIPTGLWLKPGTPRRDIGKHPSCAPSCPGARVWSRGDNQEVEVPGAPSAGWSHMAGLEVASQYPPGVRSVMHHRDPFRPWSPAWH